MRRFFSILHRKQDRHLMDGLSSGFRFVEMGSNEREMYKLSKRLSGASFIQFKVTLSLDSPKLKYEEIEKTLKQLQQLHPVLRCRIHKHNKYGYVYKETPESQIKIDIREIDGRKYENYAYSELFHKEHQKGNAMIDDIDCHKIVILQHIDTGKQEIVFCMEHFVGDGTSITNFVGEFFELLSSEKTITDYPKPKWTIPICAQTEKQLNPTNSLLSKINLQFARMNEIGKILLGNIQSGSINLPRNPQFKHLKDGEIHSNVITKAWTIVLTPNETKNLRDRCRHENSTLTTAISEALLRALGERYEEKTGKFDVQTKIGLNVITDLRNSVDPPIPNRDLTPFVGSVLFTTLPTNWTKFDKPLWKYAKLVKEELKKATKTSLIHGSIAHSFYQFLPTTKMIPGLVLSSWGSKLPIKKNYKNNITITDLELFQNFNFLTSLMFSAYPADPNCERFKLVLFAPIPFYEEEDCLAISKRVKDILIEMSHHKHDFQPPSHHHHASS